MTISSQLRATWPLIEGAGPVTTAQRELIHKAADGLEILEQLTVHALGCGALDDDTPLWHKVAELTGRDPKTGNPL